ncbi:outer membrane protein assembly factor BamE [Leptolyngbya sp. 15MV]|nr:outer membrane protein assembly factor BamE [Leptolyngbya sp. 15MV]
MQAGRALGAAAAMLAALAASGCSSIRESRGYIQDSTLMSTIQPGIDNRQSVTATLGRPSFTSQFGQPTWYYVSSITGRSAFTQPQIRVHSVLAIQFDAAGNVVSAETSGMERVVALQPDGNKTPTLGRERTFFEDLFGNIGQVGAGAGPTAPGG